MQVKTAEEARALVGRTFEHASRKRTVTHVDGFPLFGDSLNGVHVYWRRPPHGADMRTSIGRFNRWLVRAREVMDP